MTSARSIDDISDEAPRFPGGARFDEPHPATRCNLTSHRQERHTLGGKAYSLVLDPIGRAPGAERFARRRSLQSLGQRMHGSRPRWSQENRALRRFRSARFGSRSGVSLGSGRDVSDVLDPSPDLALEHALQLGQAQRPITSECPVVLLTLVDGDHSEPITEFAIADSLDRLEHAQMAWGEYGSGRGPNSRGPRRHYRLAAPPRQISNSHDASHCLPLSVPAVNS